MKRGDFCKVAATAVGIGGGAISDLSPAKAGVTTQASADVAQIYELQAAFHQAKTAQDLDLMMSLWAPDATLKVANDPKSPHVGADQLRTYWQNSGSYKNRRLSLVPSYKTRITVRGKEADLYFECHDIGDYDLPTRSIVNDTFLAGTLRNVGGKWVFYNMSAGPSTPLSLDKFYA
jgi:hypothetical protein